MEQHGTTRRQEESGFSLVELLIYMGLLGILMTMVFSSFTPVMRSSSRQSRIAETKIETAVGLDILQGDLDHAGFGLPWTFPKGGATPSPYLEPAAPAAMNDFPNIPRAVLSEDVSAKSLNGSDYLSIKALNVATNDASQKWGVLGRNAARDPAVQTLSNSAAFIGTDRVIVIRPQASLSEPRQLVLDGSSYVARPTSLDLTPYAPPPTPFDPNGEKYLVYGIDDKTDPRRPFNRTDYYINAAGVTGHCAPGTGTLVKATLNHADNNFTIMPIVDCVADFQVVYYLDTDGNGGWDTRANASGLASLTAKQIREQVKAIRCYLLTHEGGVDPTYTHPNPNKNVGEIDQVVVNALPTKDPDSTAGGVLLAGRAFALNTNIGATWANYRWKVYSIAVSPKNF